MAGRKGYQARFMRSFLAVAVGLLGFALADGVVHADLEILPEQSFESQGLAGGPFSPTFMDYTLTNTTDASFFCVIDKTADWLDLDPAWLELEPNIPRTISVSINADANSLTPGIYSDTLVFTNVSTGQEQMRDVTLTVGQYAGGTGDPNDPFQIAEPNQLIFMSQHPEHWDKHFLLTADINLALADPNTFTTALIAPDGSTGFAGSFDGNGHSISNLVIDTLGEDKRHLGLFGSIQGYGAKVKNLGLENVNITGGNDSERLGGLCGWNYHGSISNCYSKDLVIIGNRMLGGLCGMNMGSISNCYATGSVTGGENSDRLGGLSGSNGHKDYTTKIINCYSTVSVTGGAGSTYLGGLCGSNNLGVISNCFWDIDTSGLPVSNGGFGRTTLEMQTATTFIGWGSGYWTISAGEYPRLTWENASGAPIENIPSRTYIGSGTSDDPFMLSNATDLLCLASRQEDWSRCFALAGDIDMTGVSNYLPIGNFRGKLDGRGYQIQNLIIYEPGSSQLGLIGNNDIVAEIYNLSVKNISVTGYHYLGGLCGLNNRSDINNCYVTGSVIGRNSSETLGGLCGLNYRGDINNCYSSASVTGGIGTENLGGLCGLNYRGDINNCYSSASVNGGDNSFYLGGLCGSNTDGGYVKDCYSTASVVGGDNTKGIGGLCGLNFYSIYGCYATSPVTSGDGSENLGGLCGENNVSINCCYSTGSVTGGANTSRLGGLCGYNRGGIGYCYSIGSVTGGANTSLLGGLCGFSYGGETKCYFLDTAGPDNGFGQPYYDPNLMVQDYFDGWDFVGEEDNGTVDHWQMCLDGYDYPRLTWQFNSPADFLHPGRVDNLDLFTLTHDWLSTNSRCCDIYPPDGDNIVNLLDYIEFSRYWLTEP